jgi:trans-aconitate 2-methyltransferase
MKSSEEIKEFYDNYQFKFRHNIRHYIIINKLVDFGLKTDSKVLEIGCGNGAITKLIAKKVKKGKISSVDISSESIATARENLKNYSNVSFVISDVIDFNTSEKFDVIVVADMLEHIPMEHHDNLFKKLSAVLEKNGFIFINIPEPKFLEWVAEKEPDKLQVVDQPIHSEGLMNIAYKNGLYLKELKSYSIFKMQPDYQYVLFVKKSTTLNYESIPKWKIILNKYYYFFRNLLK